MVGQTKMETQPMTKRDQASLAYSAKTQGATLRKTQPRPLESIDIKIGSLSRPTQG